MERVRVEKIIDGVQPEQAFAFLLDVDHYSELMPNVNSVEVLEQSGQTRVTRWDTEIDGAPLGWVEHDSILPEELAIRFESIEADFESLRGSWEVVRSDSRVAIACELEYSLGIAFLEEHVGPILKQKITENLDIMLTGLAKGMGGL